jgi:predicted O-methyltransferase YrrM
MSSVATPGHNTKKSILNGRVDVKNQILEMLSKLGWHLNNAQRRSLSRMQQDVESLHLLPELGLSYIPWTTASLRPARIRALLNEVVIHQRKSVLEFGSGISTLYLAKYFDGSDKGQVISVEEDEEWATIVEGYLEELGVSQDRFQVLRAPLQPFDGAQNPDLWYDTEVLETELRKQNFDMVFVDGPVSWGNENKSARYPALPFVKDRLQEDSVTFLDDAEWGDQKKILRRWATDYGLETELVAGMGVLRPTSSDASYDII